jgi:hypothetical protein
MHRNARQYKRLFILALLVEAAIRHYRSDLLYIYLCGSKKQFSATRIILATLAHDHIKGRQSNSVLFVFILVCSSMRLCV